MREGAAAPPGGELKTGEHQTFIEWFSETWGKANGVEYDFDGGKDGRHVKKLLEKYAVEQLRGMTRAMMGDTWGKTQGLGVLWSQRNKWNALAAAQEPVPKGDSYSAKKMKELSQ